MQNESLILLTDLYELTMLAGYFDAGMQDVPAVFEYTFRRLPHDSGYCIFAGLDPLLDDLQVLHFSESDLSYLRKLGIFKEELLRSIESFPFECDVFAPSEGSLVFPNETILRVHGRLSQAQIIETLVLNRLNYQTLIATKASRCVSAAQGDPIVEFGLRRAQGPDGGVSGTRAAFIGGAKSTSNVMAGKFFDIPVMGTHAHSWVMAFDTELESFRAYARAFPDNPILLIDTYDTLASGLPNAITVFKELREQGHNCRGGIRLDSGDIAKLSKAVYEAFAAAGFPDPVIVASNELDEHLVAEIKSQGAKVNSWGIGTKLITGGSEPALGGVYKLSAIGSQLAAYNSLLSKMKISNNPEKTTDPGVKMPYRFYSHGRMVGDVMFLEDGEPAGDVTSYDRMLSGRTTVFPASCERKPLLEKVMQNGRRLFAPRPLQEIQSYARNELSVLPAEMKRLINPELYWVGLSGRLAEIKRDEIGAFWASREPPPVEPTKREDIGGES